MLARDQKHNNLKATLRVGAESMPSGFAVLHRNPNSSDWGGTPCNLHCVRVYSIQYL